ncbi:MAG: hypothetical protein JWP57_2179 [Spirosoma sp.]|nr:hypothetical protein [Spirosoma sp.]
MKMSQNAIITSTRNWLGRLGLLAGAVAVVLACEEPKEIGLPPTTPVDIAYSDTLTIVRETIRLDSVRSNDQSNLMVGRYTDPVFGKVQAKAFVQLTSYRDFVVTDSSTTNVTAPERIVYDSTRLFLDYDRLYYGDTLQTQELQVYRLSDSLTTTSNYDISSTARADAQPLVRQVIRPRPNTTDSLSFRLPLPDAFGRELITLANTDAGKLTNAALFRAQIRRGLMLTTTSTDKAAMLGFSTGSAVVVYYHVKGEQSTRAQGFLLSGKRFNQITADRTGTPLATLQKGQVLAASATGGRTFVQPATGVTTKLTFPTLTNLVKTGRVAINRADLVITPTNPNDVSVYIPPIVVLAEVDEKNVVRQVPSAGFPYIVPSSGPVDRTANSFISTQEVYRDTRTNSYTFELGGYFQSIISNLTPNTGLVLLTPGGQLFPTSSSTGGRTNATQQYLSDRVWRMALDGKASVKLIVFYTTSQ